MAEPQHADFCCQGMHNPYRDPPLTCCSCGNRFDGDNLCMVSACEREGTEEPRTLAADVAAGLHDQPHP